jgi:hypothetical protein
MAPKIISHSDIVGDSGIALIHTIVNGMGFVWTPTGLEAGIDGYIEIRDATSGEVANLVIQVQSKATEKDFQSETLGGLDFYCKARDLDYWLGGNAPVILVRSRPSTKEAYWVSIKDYFKDLSRRKSGMIHFNKTRDKFDANCRNALLKLATPKDSGFYLAALPKNEKLYSNLLKIDSFTDKIYLAETDFRDYKILSAKLREMGGNISSEWILKNKRILSLHNLEEFPWSGICDQGTVEPFDTSEWADSCDADFQNDFKRLLLQCLKEKLKPDVRYHKENDYFHFTATEGLSKREVAYKSLVQNTSREVFRAYPKKNDANQIGYCRHSAFIGRFLNVDGSWYLEITPTYHFTHEGRRQHRYHQDLLKRIKEIERNPAVLGQVVMWADYIRGKQNLFTKPYPFLTFGSLMCFDTDTGLDDDLWLHREGKEESKFIQSPDNQLFLFGAASE